MLYLPDASVLITAHNLYYPIDRVPEYWEWLSYISSVRLKVEQNQLVIGGWRVDSGPIRLQGA
jgi:Domain of unknown function (DUF4411)